MNWYKMQTTRLKKIMTTRGSNFVAPLIACVDKSKRSNRSSQILFSQIDSTTELTQGAYD